MSPIPTKGIINNIFNPFVVFTIFYDYFKIKGNLYMYSKSLLSFVEKFYKDLLLFRVVKGKKVKPFYVSPSQFRKGLYGFSLGLDKVFGFMTEEKIRQLFLMKVKNPDFQIPSTGIGLQKEFRRVINDGMLRQLNKQVQDMDKMVDDIVRLNPFNIDPNQLKHYPIFVALLNSVTRMDELLKEFRSLLSPDLLKFSKDLSQISVESCFNKDRNKILDLITVGKTVNLGFAVINDTTVYSSVLSSTTNS